MVIEINKTIQDLKIGLYGTRIDCFANVLIKNNINFQQITDIDDIDETYDFVFESGVYKIIPEKILLLPKFGFIGTHETPLPEGKGHAPIQWTVLNKRRNMTITLYKLNKGIDSGQIICQHNVPLCKTDTLEVLDRKRKKGIEECFEIFIKELKSGYIVLRQQAGSGSYHKKRTWLDSQLDVDKKLIDLWDEIRICHNQDYPAWFIIDNKKIIIRYEVTELE